MVHSPGNILSVWVFFFWIPIALWGAYRWPSSKAAALLLLLPLMFLPEVVYFKLSGLPIFDKQRIAIFWLLLGVLLFQRHRLRYVRLGRLVLIAMIVLIMANVVTVFTNSDPVDYGAVYIPPHVPYDAVHAIIQDAFDYLLPFLLGVMMFTGPRDLRVLFRTLVGAGLVYSLFQLVEIRLSPQLHVWVYGFFQHNFMQTMRGGGFRPTVFMENGLAVAMFTVLAIIAAAALHKTRIKVGRIPASWIVAYLWIVLLLSKSQAALLYTFVVVPPILFLSSKVQLRLAVVLAVLVLAYPWARGSGLVPVEDIRDWVAENYGEDRVGSLMTRFVNEERLLERADEKYLFGWGWYGRAYLYDEETASPEAIRDGDWIITVGDWGRVGFLAKYLLMLLPLFIAARRVRHVRGQTDKRLLAALALLLGVSAFDFLPNGNFNYLVFVLSGALLSCSAGVLEFEAQTRRRKRELHQRRRVSGALPEAAGSPATPSPGGPQVAPV